MASGTSVGKVIDNFADLELPGYMELDMEKKEVAVNLLTTDHPLYAKVVEVLTEEVRKKALSSFMSTFGMSWDGVVQDITDEQYEKAFSGAVGSGYGDVLAGAALADVTGCSVRASCEPPQSRRRFDSSALEVFDRLAQLSTNVIAQQFGQVKERYDKNGDYGSEGRQFSTFGLFEDGGLGMQCLPIDTVPGEAGGVGNTDVDYYREQSSDGVLSVGYPDAYLDLEHLSPDTSEKARLAQRDWFAACEPYDLVMQMMFGAVFRGYFRGLSDMSVVGPRIVTSASGVRVESPVIEVSVGYIGLNQVDFAEQDVLISRARTCQVLGALRECGVLTANHPEVRSPDKYYPAGRHTYVCAAGVLAESRSYTLAECRLLTLGMVRAKTLTVIIPGDASYTEVYVAHENFSLPSVCRVMQESAAAEAIHALLGVYF